MGFFKKLLTPSLPDIRDTEAVVEWFFNHDEKITDVQEKVPQPHLSNLKSTIKENIRRSGSAEELQTHIDDASAMYDSALRTLYEFHQIQESGQVPDGMEPEQIVTSAAQAVVLEACGSAMLRIYGYFMVKRFNTEPRTDRPTDQADPGREFGPLASAAEDFRNILKSREPDANVSLLRVVLPPDEELGKCLALASSLGQSFLELLYLRIFCTDFAVLNAFHQHEELQDKRGLHHEMWASFMTEEQALGYDQRFGDYSQAMVDAKEGQSTAEVLGRKFAEIHAGNVIRVSLTVTQFNHDVIMHDVKTLRTLVQTLS